MTTSIIAAACAFALGTITLSAQDNKTTDIYIINGERVENFDGSQLEGRTISSYKIMTATGATETNTIHFIETDGKTIESVSSHVFINGKPATEEELDSLSTSNIKEITIKGQSVETFNGNETVFVFNGKKISADEFNEIKPNKIKSVKVAKDPETIAKYGEGENTKAVILMESK